MRAIPWDRRASVLSWEALARGGGALAGLLALAVFLARAPLSWCVLTIGGGIALVVLLLNPALALLALAFTVPFGSLRQLSLGGVTVGASELVLLGLLGAWLLRMMATRRAGSGQAARLSIRLAPLTFAVLLYLGAALAALWPAQYLPSALKELAKWVEFLLLYLFVASEFQNARQAKTLQLVVGALLLAGTFEALLGIYQFLRRVGPEEFVLFGRYMRAYGTFEQPNPFGGYLGLLLPLAYATVLTRGREALTAWRTHRWGALLLWLLAIVATATMSAALVMSWSRGALLGLAAGAGLVVLALGRRAWLALALVALLLVMLPQITDRLAQPSALLGRLTDVVQYVGMPDLSAVEINDDNFAVIERAAHWYAAWQMFSRHPWLGVGLGQYAAVYPSVALPRWQDPLGHAHNYFLNVLAESGLPGLAAYLLLSGVALSVAWHSARRERGWRRGVALGALGMMGHLLAHNLFDNLYVHELYLIVALLLGMVASLQSGGIAWPNPSRRAEHWRGAKPLT